MAVVGVGAAVRTIWFLAMAFLLVAPRSVAQPEAAIIELEAYAGKPDALLPGVTVELSSGQYHAITVTDVEGSSTSVVSLDALYAEADVVAYTRVVAAESGLGYKLEVLKAFKGSEPHGWLYMSGPASEIGLHSRQIVFLTREGSRVIPSSSLTDSTNGGCSSPFRPGAPVFKVLLEGYGLLPVRSTRVFKDVTDREYGWDGVDVCRRVIILPESFVPVPEDDSTSACDRSWIPLKAFLEYLQEVAGRLDHEEEQEGRSPPTSGDARDDFVGGRWQVKQQGRVTTHAVGPFIEGIVRFPDGSPAAGAAVEALSWPRAAPDEQSAGIGLKWTEETDGDGVFQIPTMRELRLPSRTLHLPLFGWDARVHLFASLEEELWLRTGKQTFYPRANGPLVEVSIVEGEPQHGEPLEIRLGARGAELSLTSWESAAGKRVEAEIAVRRTEGQAGSGGVIWFSTGGAGAPPSRLLLPAGEYEIELNSYRCGGKRLSPTREVKQLLSLEPGERRSVMLAVDSSGRPCTAPEPSRAGEGTGGS